MNRDVGDILDRWAIAKLKAERVSTEEHKKEFIAFSRAIEEIKIKYSQYDWSQFSKLMLMVNDFIWQFEAGSKSGKEKLPNPHYIFDEKNKECLAKLGIINIEIKNYNSLRVEIKNVINKLTNTGFQDVKKDHLSET